MNDLKEKKLPAALLRRARLRWGILTVLSVLGMAVVLPRVGLLGLDVRAWAIAPVLWLLLAVPATVGMYGHYFRDDWQSDVSEEADDFLRGVTSVWGVLAAGVGLSLGACLLAGTAMAGIWPGALMLMLLVLARPSSGPGLA